MDATRVVLAHDWLTGMRGGEKVLESFCRLWPAAPLYTVIHQPGSVSPLIENRPITASYLNHLPRVQRYYRYLLPLMPGAVNWKLPECDVVVSSSSCVAKGVTPPAGVPHVCYCHSPMRYAWHMRDSYGWRGVKGWLIDRLLNRIRAWDRATSSRVTHFVANSKEVQRRIRDCYDRDSVVIYPPADTDFYHPAPVRREDYYLVVSAFAPYKRLDLAIEACKRLGRRLVVIGAGQDEAKLRQQAGAGVAFLGWQTDAAIREHFQRARALLFPGLEDFGIVPVEAQACGCPVIAFGRGGATETVVPLGERRPTGVWFGEQTADALVHALETFESHADAFDPATLRTHALGFNTARFEREMSQFVAQIARTSQVRAA